jgi:hypothetical protein
MARDLAADLSACVTPVSRWHVARRLLFGTGVGALVAIVFVLAVLGPRPDMPLAMRTTMFWMKLLYPLSLALVAGLAAERLARPAASMRERIVWLAVPVLAVLVLATIQFALAPPSARMPLLMGGSARICPLLVLASALAPLAGLIWAMRGLAPTQLRAAGAVIGLAAGGVGAFAYAWHCTETGGAFLAVWYTLGIAASAFVGWLAGPSVLRWR